jgi:phosphate transport system substrate-binding protein
MERVHTWGDLGLTGEWASRPVHLYGFGINYDESFLFEHDVMKGSQKWREGLHEGATPQAISAAVAKDPNAIGITSLDGVPPAIKVLAVQDEEGHAVQPTQESLREGLYALERHVYAYFNKDKKEQFATVQKFLHFCLSEEGQAMAQGAGFLPLSANAAHESLEAVK